MKKILTLFAFATFVFFSLLPSAAYAKDYEIPQPDGQTKVTATVPDNLTEDVSEIKIFLRADRDYFSADRGYVFTVSQAGKVFCKGIHNGKDLLGGTYNNGSAIDYGITFDSSRQVVANFTCTHNNRGSFSFDFWQGTIGEGQTSANTIAQIPLAILPKGGSEPTLSAACQVQEGQAVDFTIKNTQSGIPYTVWLDKSVVTAKTVTGNGGDVSDVLPGSNKTENRRLCMEIVKPGVLAGTFTLDCKYNIPISFVPTTTSATCTNNSTPTINTTAGLGDPTKPYQLQGCGTAAGSGIQTALGCIPTDNSNSFIGWFLRWALGISGGIAFILMIFAGFQIMTSTGNPDKIQGGKELLNAAISGLILIIFSVFLLKLIGVDILGLPGFGS